MGGTERRRLVAVLNEMPRALTLDGDEASRLLRACREKFGCIRTGSGINEKPDGASPLEARVAKLEASVEHIATDTFNIKDELKTLRSNARTDFRLVFGALISVALGLAAIMAKGFHWI